MFDRDGWIEVRSLARESGLGRATLYRRYEDRDRILGEAIWAIAKDEIARLRTKIDATGGELITQLIRRILLSSASYPAMRTFVEQHTEVAMRIMTSREGVVHQRLVTAIAKLIRDEIGTPTDIDIDDLAYGVVRIGESFYYREILAGNSPDIDAAAAMIRRVLT